jgi:hypothetical protein
MKKKKPVAKKMVVTKKKRIANALRVTQDKRKLRLRNKVLDKWVKLSQNMHNALSDLRKQCGYCELVEHECDICPMYKLKICCGTSGRTAFTVWDIDKSLSYGTVQMQDVIDAVTKDIKKETNRQKNSELKREGASNTPTKRVKYVKKEISSSIRNRARR